MKRLLLLTFLLTILPVIAESEDITTETIPDLNLTTGSNTNLIDLDDYFNGTDLYYKYKAGDKGLEGITITIDTNYEVDITANAPGEFSVIFVADNDTDDRESNDVLLTVTGDALIETEFFPESSSLTLKEAEEQTFSIEVANGTTIRWFLENERLEHAENTYTFTAEEEGIFDLKVMAGTKTKTWTISVQAEDIEEPPLAEEPTGPICGNNIREEGENCSNCPDDATCSADATCEEGVCIIKEKSFKFLIWPLIGFSAVIIIVTIGIVLYKKKVFSKKEPKTEIKEQPQPKQEQPKQEPTNQEILPLIDYFKTNLNKYKKEDLIKQASQQGWTQQQIDQALTQLTKPQNTPA